MIGSGSPPMTITGKEVKARLYNKIKVYSYKYVASQLRGAIVNIIVMRRFASPTYSRINTRTLQMSR